ncbi:MAG: GIY-YIG nuclease family protein [Peptococcaceae bacterium]|nr:GIY-YIG nuclease family protein [Peptococcaceae bacterium]
MGKHYVYLLACRDGSYYCGYSTDPVARAETHNRGKGAKYTRSRLPVRLVYTESYESKEAAMSREWHLKRLSHSQKAQLVRDFAAEGEKE